MSESDAVLDAAAVLALVKLEEGWESVSAVEHRAISTVNFAEAATVLSRQGVPLVVAMNTLRSLNLDVIAFDSGHAHDTARLYPLTRSRGMSLGDRACVALARSLGIPAMTSDRAWGTNVDGVAVVQIR